VPDVGLLVLQRPAVPVEPGHDARVAGLEEGVASLELWSPRVLPDFLSAKIRRHPVGKRKYTVEQSADEFGVNRPTIYRNLSRLSGTAAGRSSGRSWDAGLVRGSPLPQPRTVEYHHLRKAYRKLGIRSRA
jgi:hypothetical protein